MTLIILLSIILVLGILVYLRVHFSTKEFNCYQLIPNVSSGFDYHKANQLLDRLSELIKPSNFIKAVFNQQQLRLLIDNKGKHGRIRLIIKIDSRLSVDSIKHLVKDIDSQLELRAIACPMPNKKARTAFFKLKKHYAFSLATNSHSGPDPMIGLSHSFAETTKATNVQLEIRLTQSNTAKTIYLRNRLLKGLRPRLYANSPIQLAKKVIWFSAYSLIKLVHFSLLLIEESLKTQSSNHYQPKESKHVRKVDDEVGVRLLDKLYDNLWSAQISTHIVSASPVNQKKTQKQLELAINNYGIESDNKLYRSKLSSSSILSNSELANFFKLPQDLENKNIFETNNFKNLPASPEFTLAKKNSVVIGENNYANQRTLVRLSEQDRQRHLYVLGATGSGKSTLLSGMLNQDIHLNHGLTLIDPHGDLAQSLLQDVESKIMDKVIYFDPSDIEYPIGLNLLEISALPGTTEYFMEVERVAEGIISLFRKLFSEDGESGGHRVEYIIRNSVYTALSVNNCTIFTVFKILTNSDFRQKVVAKLKNPDLINFWQQELGKAGDYQRVKMSAGVTAKIGRLLFSAPTRRVFGQTKSTINFDDILDNKKILICNFSKGRLGEDSSKLFGIAVLTKIQQAALRRASVDNNKRTNHYLYIDEFQNFATPAVTQLMSESRKYKLFLTLANQSLSQIDPKLSSVIMANTGNLICFRNPNPKDESSLLPLLSPYLEEGNLLNIPAYHYYLKSTGISSLPPLSVSTITRTAKDDKSTEAIRRSRRNYALNLGAHGTAKSYAKG